MKHKQRDFGLEIKEIDAAGHFAGYASVYDVIDSYRESVAPGAFAASLDNWKAKGRMPPVLWQHKRDEPVGPFTVMREDKRGLYVEGHLLVDEVQRAREARALIKSGTISGLSIGFNTIVDEFNRESGITTLKQIDLWEVSIVTFPANQAAQVEAVKAFAAGKLPTVREFEDFLREAGFSKSQSAAIATHGLGRLLRDADDQQGDAGAAIKSLLADVFKPQAITIEELFR
jgi:HK97 family phage prohead protease